MTTRLPSCPCFARAALPRLAALAAGVLLAAGAAGAARAGAPQAETPPPYEPVGGANAPEPTPPPTLVGQTTELDCGTFRVRVPSGTYTAPAGGPPDYGVPGPIVAFRGPDGVWRGHGYLETWPTLESFEGTVEGTKATLAYRFAGGARYDVTLTAAKGALLLDETSTLGPRNVFVFDCYYNWQPSAGFVTNLGGTRHAFVTLPCHYDRPEGTLNPAARGRPGPDGAAPARESLPGGLAVVHPAPAARDIAGLWCRTPDTWQNGEAMPVELWQRRQRPGRPGTRHVLGPETKSDSTPNPRTAEMVGPSLYEGHVTLELHLGAGTRRLGFAVTAKPEAKADLAKPFEAVQRAHP